MRRSGLVVVVVLVSLMLVTGQLQAGDVTLQAGITGSNNLEGLRDPVTVIRYPVVSELLQAVADRPRSAAFIDHMLDGSDVNLALLVDLGLLKQWKDDYAVSFNYLTLEDHELLLATLAPFAESLAQSYRDRWPEFEAIFNAHNVTSVDKGELAYAVIGAMSLDWDGLDLTADRNLRMTAADLPGNRDFIVWAKERSEEVNVRELYWGSHNTLIKGIQFTTFGDHYLLPRLALPDLLWATGSRIANVDPGSGALGASLYKALAPYYQDDFLADAGAILGALRERTLTVDSLSETTGTGRERTEAILALLWELQYVSRDGESYVLAVPFLSLADKPMTDAARELSWLLMESWLDRNYSTVRAELETLTVLEYGVPYRQLFTQIWHYLFGLTNKALVASGHFADPYAEKRIAKGMLPFVFDVDLIELRTELGR